MENAMHFLTLFSFLSIHAILPWATRVSWFSYVGKEKTDKS